MIRYILHFLTFSFLTILTQVGGLAYLLFLYINRKLSLKRFKSFGLFIGLYFAVSVFIVPLARVISSRKPLPLTGDLRPLTLWTVLLNRHYVDESLNESMANVASEMVKEFPGTHTNYLDANFPFWNGFPLIPHLSHNDGKKLDLAFYYTENSQVSNSAPSFIGYGAYEEPKQGELNYPKICTGKGYWQYGLIGKLVPVSSSYQVDEDRTRKLLLKLAANSEITKIFIEPHLKNRWGLSEVDKIRFHGCQAVRHDDHIHLQIR